MTIRNPGGDGRPGTRAADGDPQQADAVAGADRDADAPAAGTTLGPRFEQLRAAWSDLIRRSLERDGACDASAAGTTSSPAPDDREGRPAQS